jgi:hypothetical protein
MSTRVIGAPRSTDVGNAYGDSVLEVGLKTKYFIETSLLTCIVLHTPAINCSYFDLSQDEVSQGSSG